MTEKHEKTKEGFFQRIEKILRGFTAKENIQDVKARTNRIVTDAKIKAQSKWVKEALHKREQELEKQKPSKEVTKEKEAFRLRMYQATSKRSKDADKTLEKK